MPLNSSIPCLIAVEDIVEFQAAHAVGKNWKEIHVKLKDGKVCSVPKKDNELVFGLGLLPKPSRIFDQYEKSNQIARKEKNGFATEYTPFIPYPQNPPVTLKAVAGHYDVNIQSIKKDIDAGQFPKDAIHEKGGKKFLIVLQSLNITGNAKGQMEKRKTTTTFFKLSAL